MSAGVKPASVAASRGQARRLRTRARGTREQLAPRRLGPAPAPAPGAQHRPAAALHEACGALAQLPRDFFIFNLFLSFILKITHQKKYLQI